MKQGWLALALLAALAGLALWHAASISDLTGELAAALEQAESLAEGEDWAEAERITREAQDRWDKAGLQLHITMDHEVMDEVSVGFAETLEFLEAQEQGEYSAANARLIKRLELLGEMEQPTPDNLL